MLNLKLSIYFLKNKFGRFTKSLYLCSMTLTDIMNQGYDSFFDGLPIEYNPYSINTPEYRVWVTGYEDAKYGSFKK